MRAGPGDTHSTGSAPGCLQPTPAQVARGADSRPAPLGQAGDDEGAKESPGTWVQEASLSSVQNGQEFLDKLLELIGRGPE